MAGKVKHVAINLYSIATCLCYLSLQELILHLVAQKRLGN